MTQTPYSKKRAKLLSDLEYLIGSSCYNGNIQNHGPGGVAYVEGRTFRYPLTLITSDGEKLKQRNKVLEANYDDLQSGFYAFGANRLGIVEALDNVLTHLETNHNLKL